MRDTLKDSEKQSSHVTNCCMISKMNLALKNLLNTHHTGQRSGRGGIIAVTGATGCSFPRGPKVSCSFCDYLCARCPISLCNAAEPNMTSSTKGRMKCGVFEDLRFPPPFRFLNSITKGTLPLFTATVARPRKFWRACHKGYPR